MLLTPCQSGIETEAHDEVRLRVVFEKPGDLLGPIDWHERFGERLAVGGEEYVVPVLAFFGLERKLKEMNALGDEAGLLLRPVFHTEVRP